MNNNEQNQAEKIRGKYTEHEKTDLDKLYELDAQVRRPAKSFSYIFGSISAVIMGAGMSLIMTDIGSYIGLSRADINMIIGIAVGGAGLILSLLTYPIYKGILRSRKKKYAKEIIALSDKIINE